MLSLTNIIPFNRKKYTSDYQQLKGDCKSKTKTNIDSIIVIPQPIQFENLNFDIIQLPNSLAGETEMQNVSWWRLRRITTQFPTKVYNAQRDHKGKNCDVVTNHLKKILKKQPAEPIILSQKGEIMNKKLKKKKLNSNKISKKILIHLNNTSDGNFIISKLKKEPHHSYQLKERRNSDPPLRGVCLEYIQSDLDSQTISENDVIDVTKALTMRIIPSSEVINLITGLSVGKLVGALGESTGVFDALAIASKSIIDRTETHQNLIGMVPKDRVSIWSYWWGFEIAIPIPSIERLKQARSIQTTIFQILTALTAASGAIEIYPLIKYLSNYLDIEWNAISAEDKGKGVVIAATWAFPMALVPRPWDFDAPIITNSK